MSKLPAKPVLIIKKIVVSILSSDMVAGAIRKIYKNRIPHYNRIIYTGFPMISNTVVGNIFFKSYESSEIRFAHKYMYKDTPVVELGASLGVMSMQIAGRTLQPVYSVEANPELIPVINNNLKKNNVKNCTVFNCIIATSGEQFYFVKGGDNTTGHITSAPVDNATKVRSISLTDFLSKNNIAQYILVCDIEGAEIYILKEDINALVNCKQIIIELHDTSYDGQPVIVPKMVKLIEGAGFSIVDEYGANMVFERK